LGEDLRLLAPLVPLVGRGEGAIVAFVGVPSFVVTLGGFLIWQGVILNKLEQRGTIIIQDRWINYTDAYIFSPFAGYLIAAILTALYPISILYKLVVARGDTLILRDPTQSTADVVSLGELKYNVEAHRGSVTNITTAIESGEKWFVSAREAAFVSDTARGHQTAFYARNGSITSCDDSIPDYHFQSKEIKMIAKDIMVARPAVLYIADVPVMWLPFIFQDMRSGRRSGVLTPQFGVSEIFRNSPTYRRHIENLGYYFALNDYTDAQFSLDWRSGANSVAGDPGWAKVNGEWRYRWLNRFLTGRFAVSKLAQRDGTGNTAYSWAHQQDFSQNSHLSTDLNYVTNTVIQRQTTFDPRQVLASIGSRRYRLPAHATVRLHVRDGGLLEIDASRRRLVEAADGERRALQQTLARGPRQRLQEVSELFTKAGAAGVAPVGADLLREVEAAITELSELANGVRPGELGGGLRAALPVLAARSPLDVSVLVRAERLPDPVEAAAYFVCSEALANAAKHAGAASAHVEAVMDSGRLCLVVSDDGVGGADAEGAGLRGLRDRVEALSGRLRVQSPPGAGTRVLAEIPCNSR